MRSQRMQGEIAELWTETFGERPAISAEPQVMLQILVECLQDVGPFDFSNAPAPARTVRRS